ncbi:MAG: hypothetical protein ABIP93_10935 [Gemmatimonadaceae bacterium]
MSLAITQGVPTLFLRRASYERAGLTRASLDERLGLTDAEFRVDGGLVALGPIYDVDALGALVDDLEKIGLVYYDDYFELSGSWPEWLLVLASDAASGGLTSAS